jgi:hypothetical protein
MMKYPDPRRGVLCRLGLAVAALLTILIAPAPPANAVSLINPGATPTAKFAADALTTEVHGGGGHGGGGHGGGGFHGGGGGYHGGGYHGGGFHGGGFGYRPHFHRGFYGPVYYGGPSYYPYHHCRIILTYYGPRRVCHFRHWHRWHHWHHRHHHWHVY